MTLSIIFPVYNTGRAIIPVLKTLNKLSQNIINNMELIFVIDGSPKSEKKIINNKLKWDRNFKIIEQKNTGPSIARFNGLNESSGDYIWFFDPDDDFLIEKLLKCFNIIESNKWDVIMFNMIERNMSDGWCFYTKNHLFDKDIEWNNFLKEKLYFIDQEGFRSCSLCNKIIRRNILKKIDFNFPHKYNEDTYVWMQCLSKINTCKYINDFIYIYCIRDYKVSSMSELNRRVDLNINSMLSVFQKIFLFYSKKYIFKNCNFSEINKIINHYIYSDLYSTKKISIDEYNKYLTEINNLYKKHKNFKYFSNNLINLYKRYEKNDKEKKHDELIQSKSISDRLRWFKYKFKEW